MVPLLIGLGRDRIGRAGGTDPRWLPADLRRRSRGPSADFLITIILTLRHLTWEIWWSAGTLYRCLVLAWNPMPAINNHILIRSIQIQKTHMTIWNCKE